MSGFSAEWLGLRQPADERARWRNGARRFLKALPASGMGPLVDLACGSGANCRYLAPLLLRPGHWLFVDNDGTLLAEALRNCAELPGASTIAGHERDLAGDLDFLAEGRPAGVTAAALLDLVSKAWLERLAELTAPLGVPLLFALTYDGRIALLPDDPDDDEIRQAVNRHQRGDKGFGPALGPDATAVAAELLVDRGYLVVRKITDWQLDATDESDAALIRRLVDGWAGAASELASSDLEKLRIALWLRRRTGAIADARLRVRVGHQDLLALPVPRK